MGEEIVNALSLAGIGDLDAEGAKRSRESQEALNRFQAARDRARAGEQRRANEAAQAEKKQADERAKQEKQIADERRSRAEKIAELEAKLNARKESDAVRLGKLNDRIAKLQYAEQFRVGDDLQRTRLERLTLEVERNELVGEIQARNEEHRKELQDEYIRAEEAYLAARERAEERITAEINNRANSLMPDTQATGSQQDRIARLRKDLARSAQQLQNAEARGLPTADLRARVRTRAARLAEAESVVEEQTRRVASVVTLGVKDALGEKLDKQITAQENLQPLARDMEKSRMALQNIEKALSVGVK
jgi:translation initiation factor IF-2